MIRSRIRSTFYRTLLYDFSHLAGTRAGDRLCILLIYISGPGCYKKGLVHLVQVSPLHVYSYNCHPILSASCHFKNVNSLDTSCVLSKSAASVRIWHTQQNHRKLKNIVQKHFIGHRNRKTKCMNIFCLRIVVFTRIYSWDVEVRNQRDAELDNLHVRFKLFIWSVKCLLLRQIMPGNLVSKYRK